MDENAVKVSKPNVEALAAREYQLIQELVKVRKEQNQVLEYETFEGYELPPRSQFSMLKKAAVSIKIREMTFNMASIRLFEGIQNILPMLNPEKKRLAAIPCSEEESASVEWARLNKQGVWTNKSVTAPDFIVKIYNAMGWNPECRYKVLGRITNSERGMVLLFDLDEAIMYSGKLEEYTDYKTGEVKKRQQKFYPDFYKDHIGKSYSDYAASRQMSLFENLVEYQASPVLPDAGTDSSPPEQEGGSLL